jgi:predicted RNase H-like nuclease
VTSVLGIDAAWTAGKPSGVALVRRARGRRWRCLALAPSYASFIGAQVDWTQRPVVTPLDCAALVAAATRIAGEPPNVIAIDMPLAVATFSARRAADNAIASAYATRGLGAHSPSAERPGPIADAMRVGFGAFGYRVATTTTAPRTPNVLIEVYPHAAAIALLGASYRVPYKLGRIRQYWSDAAPATRMRRLLRQWRQLRDGLAARIDDIPDALVPRSGTPAALKRHEDALDAMLCALCGIEFLDGALRAYGDATAAVWAR